MKKIIILILTLVLISGCCDREIVASYRFNEFEKNLIPYDKFEDYFFINNIGEKFVIRSQPKTSSIERETPGPESCAVTEFPVESNYLRFGPLDLLVKFNLAKRGDTFFTLITTSELHPEFNQRFRLACKGLFEKDIKDRLTTISVHELHFEDILIFKSCEPDAAIKQIFYSPENGIEFIDFANGNWLKLIDSPE